MVFGGIHVGNAVHTVNDLDRAQLHPTLPGDLHDLFQHLFKHFQLSPCNQPFAKDGKGGMVWSCLVYCQPNKELGRQVLIDVVLDLALRKVLQVSDHFYLEHQGRIKGRAADNPLAFVQLDQFVRKPISGNDCPQFAQKMIRPDNLIIEIFSVKGVVTCLHKSLSFHSDHLRVEYLY